MRQARPKDTRHGEWKKGDILYEVTLHRKDPVSMDQVSCRPTNMEVDDYAEYKRLRKIHREQRRKIPAAIPSPLYVLEAAPPMPSPQLPTSPPTAPQSLLRALSSVSPQTTFKEPAFDTPRAATDRLSASYIVSPMTVTRSQGSFFAPKKVGTLGMPAFKDNARSSLADSSETIHEKTVRVISPDSGSLSSSITSGQTDIKEIVPWIDLEDELPTPPALTPPKVVKEHVRSQAGERLELRAAELNPVKKVRRLARDSKQLEESSLRSQHAVGRDAATNALNLRLFTAKPLLPILAKKKPKEVEQIRERKSLTFGKKARFFDGVGCSVDEGDDDCHVRRFYSSSVHDLPQLCSPSPIKPLRPISLFEYGIERIEFASPLDNLTSRPSGASSLDSNTSLSMAIGTGTHITGGESIALGRLKRWLRT